MKISDLFNLHQGNGFELYNMNSIKKTNINFVSRTAQNNGVVAEVEKVGNIVPFPAGFITVALGGSVLSTFVQRKPFYTAFHVMVLEPKRMMSLNEKLFYCMCIQNNAYRYSYGRQANKTLKNIEIPESAPAWLSNFTVHPIKTNNVSKKYEINNTSWSEFEIQDIFQVKYGINMELINCEIEEYDSIDTVNFVARTSSNNGVVAKVKRIDGIRPQAAGILTCAGGGSVLSTFIQNREFYSGRDLYLLIPKYEMSIYAKLFCRTIIEANKYRFSYGRQANKSIPTLKIKLPVKNDGTPDFNYMENYIKSLPYSDRI
ncbi:MAG: restriction endonuclease subunit S [Oscillospiraceae bacterium]